MRHTSVGSQIGRIADLDGRSPPERREGAGHGWPASIPTTFAQLCFLPIEM